MDVTISSLITSLGVTGVLLIAATSIGIECYNKHPNMKIEKEGNLLFMTLMIGYGIIMFIAACIYLYMYWGKNVMVFNR